MEFYGVKGWHSFHIHFLLIWHLFNMNPVETWRFRRISTKKRINIHNINLTLEGIESLVYNHYGEAGRLAENINARLEQVGYENQGVNERPDLVVLNQTQMPSVLVEVGFINTDADNRLLDERFRETARAIAEGVLATVWSAA